MLPIGPETGATRLPGSRSCASYAGTARPGPTRKNREIHDDCPPQAVKRAGAVRMRGPGRRASMRPSAMSTGSEAEMRYLLLVGSEGLAAPQEVAVMQREIPGWTEEMERRGVLLLGRPLDLPQTAATVRVRDGETLVTDGPFAETKEFIAGFDLVECADLDEAIEVAAKGPV